MKKFLIRLCVVILFLAGMGLLTYPVISNEWNNYVQSKLIDSYQSKLNNMDTNEYTLIAT